MGFKIQKFLPLTFKGENKAHVPPLKAAIPDLGGLWDATGANG